MCGVIVFCSRCSARAFAAVMGGCLSTRFIRPVTTRVRMGRLMSGDGTVRSGGNTTTFIRPLTTRVPGVLRLAAFAGRVRVLYHYGHCRRQLFCVLCTRGRGLKGERVRHYISGSAFSGLLKGGDGVSGKLLRRCPSTPVVFGSAIFLSFLKLPGGCGRDGLGGKLVRRVGRFVLRLNGSFVFVSRRCPLAINTSACGTSLLFFRHNLRTLITIRLGGAGFRPQSLNRLRFCLRTLSHSIGHSGRGPSVNVVLYPSISGIIIRCTVDHDVDPAVITRCGHVLVPRRGVRRRLERFYRFFSGRSGSWGW